MMELVLQQKQTLNLVMTAELRQAIALLQYSTYELYQFIQEQQMENPLIELEEKVQDIPYRQPSSQTSNFDQEQSNPIDFMASYDENIYDDLLEQVQWLDIDEWYQQILQYLVLNLDENGYLPLTTKEIADQLAISELEAEEGIKYLQQLEPIGVGARSLSECLKLQMDYYYPEETFASHIVKHHLTELANKKWHALARKYNVALADIQYIFHLIQTLEPKPNIHLSSQTNEYVYPDIIITEENGKFFVQLNDHYLPDIRLNKQYLPLLNDQSSMSTYMNKQYKNYQWLLNSMEQRRSTILKITKVVIQRQKDFFKNGFASLKPLTLREVAEDIDMHESTVSRATMNKVIQTPKGSFAMRMLFSSKVDAKGGSFTSQAKVKLLIQTLIKEENKRKPLSDQKIANYLQENKGITISRRTVAKYREELKIPSSRQRKEIVV